MSKILLKKKLPSGGLIVYNDKPSESLYEIHQVHGNKVVEPQETIIEADGLFSLNPEKLAKPLAIKTADCLPITLLGDQGVAHLHAGWRGLHLAIFNENQVKSINPKTAFIGPAIHWDSYEVGPEFLEHFKNLGTCFKAGENHGKYLFNLPMAAKELLLMSYPKLSIEISDLNTFTTPGHNSYRRNKTTIRNYNVFYPEHLWK